MRICGIKLTHDGSIALLEDRRLIFSVEQEKRENNPRYQNIDNLDTVIDILADHGLKTDDIDQFVIDGWDGEAESHFNVSSGQAPLVLRGGPYVERRPDGVLDPVEGTGLVIGGKSFPYRSFSHVTGHIASAYCTSPFAAAAEPSYCLIWDGCIFPRLYHVDRGGARFLQSLFPIIGQAYAAAGHYFGPYKRSSQLTWDLGLAGKLMAFIALGSAHEDIISIFQELHEQHFLSGTSTDDYCGFGTGDAETSLASIHKFFDASVARLAGKPAEDVLASFHSFLERLLVREMGAAMLRHPYPGPQNLCIAGGCGLNIKWNSALRNTGLFAQVFVPPFPNDSGSAIGAACSAMAASDGFVSIDWSVYSGPVLRDADVPPGWKAAPCSLADLAALLAKNEPVVFLTGHAELGPRALGGRSIIASPTSPVMKDLLNDIKLREHFRPVAPICLEDRAPEIFNPGTPDPYMLFDHQTRANWRREIPAVVHLDGSARLQTMSRNSTHPIAQLLVEYESLTGIPLLCNTSANHHGRGFFPDVRSACDWGKVANVWSAGTLFSNERNERPRGDEDEYFGAATA
ncbi:MULTISPECIES: nodulation protein NodU [Rhizobium]|uniref:Nod Factor Carbamoyltransferase NodU n=2 Tax=Rhizobium TaxID=379 RepID=K0Q5X2_9HYPH|nr:MULTISPECIES: nodulation protein NodU [Rhizobium]KWV47233.1 nodulation protein NodU [Rhizobium altiplani]CCM80387.1 Nod Factor Carbamoyltransferase NodU [Rhizobium mesoamericanum STM3625]